MNGCSPAASSPAGLLRWAVDALHQQAAGRPLVLAIDDAHLLDPLSATLVYYVARTDHATVLATVKDKPSGRPQDAAVLDRRCARRPHCRAGRDGRMAPPGAEPKNGSTQEGNMPSNQTA